MRARAPRPSCLARLAFAFAVTLFFVLGVTSRALAAGDATKGSAILARKGCTGCHSMDGSPRVGPSLRGLYGANRTVTTAGLTRDVVADDAYIARALRDPDADVVVGFRGTMPRFDLGDDDVAHVARAIEQLSAPAPATTAAAASSSSSAMGMLSLSAAWFVGLHLLLSSIPVRRRLIGALKPGGFALVYSLVATLGLVGIVLSFRAAPYVEVWLPPRAFRWLPVLAMPIAILFMVAGFSTPNAASVGQGSVAAEEDAVRGIFTITRHPALCGFALWALAHLFANGELRAIIVFVAILTLAITGMAHIDRRRAAELGDTWVQYTNRTSLLPFAAIATGRAKLDLRGIGLFRILAAAFLYVAVLHTHALLIGASPMP